jgi:hypothetical protein
MFCRHITRWSRFTGAAVVVTACGSCAQGPRYDGDFWQSKSIADFTIICSRAIRGVDSVEEANARLRSLGLATELEVTSDERKLYGRTGSPNLDRAGEPIFQEFVIVVTMQDDSYYITNIEVMVWLTGP